MASTKQIDTEAEIKALSDQLSVLRKDMSALTDLLGDMGERRKSAAVHRLREGADAVRDRAEEAADDARQKAGEIEDRLMSNIREQPHLSLGVAMGVGFLVGFLSGRR